MKAYHKNLGFVKYTEACQFLQLTNPDPSSIFVEYDGEIIEVTKYFVHIYDQIFEEIK